MGPTSTVSLLPVAADNLDSLKKWCKKRFEGMEQALDKLFQEVRLPNLVDTLLLITGR